MKKVNIDDGSKIHKSNKKKKSLLKKHHSKEGLTNVSDTLTASPNTSISKKIKSPLMKHHSEEEIMNVSNPSTASSSVSISKKKKKSSVKKLQSKEESMNVSNTSTQSSDMNISKKKKKKKKKSSLKTHQSEEELMNVSNISTITLNTSCESMKKKKNSLNKDQSVGVMDFSGVSTTPDNNSIISKKKKNSSLVKYEFVDPMNVGDISAESTSSSSNKRKRTDTEGKAIKTLKKTKLEDQAEVQHFPPVIKNKVKDSKKHDKFSFPKNLVEIETPTEIEKITPNKLEKRLQTTRKLEKTTTVEPEKKPRRKPEKITPRKPENISPSKQENISPRKQENMSPGKPKNKSPKEPVNITPGKQENISLGKSENISPEKPKNKSPKKLEKLPLRKPEEITSKEPVNITPEKQENITPTKPVQINSNVPEKMPTSPKQPQNRSTFKEEEEVKDDQIQTEGEGEDDQGSADETKNLMLELLVLLKDHGADRPNISYKRYLNSSKWDELVKRLQPPQTAEECKEHVFAAFKGISNIRSLQEMMNAYVSVSQKRKNSSAPRLLQPWQLYHREHKEELMRERGDENVLKYLRRVFQELPAAAKQRYLDEYQQQQQFAKNLIPKSGPSTFEVYSRKRPNTDRKVLREGFDALSESKKLKLIRSAVKSHAQLVADLPLEHRGTRSLRSKITKEESTTLLRAEGMPMLDTTTAFQLYLKVHQGEEAGSRLQQYRIFHRSAFYSAYTSKIKQAFGQYQEEFRAWRATVAEQHGDGLMLEFADKHHSHAVGVVEKKNKRVHKSKKNQLIESKIEELEKNALECSINIRFSGEPVVPALTLRAAMIRHAKNSSKNPKQEMRSMQETVTPEMRNVLISKLKRQIDVYVNDVLQYVQNLPYNLQLVYIGQNRLKFVKLLKGKDIFEEFFPLDKFPAYKTKKGTTMQSEPKIIRESIFKSTSDNIAEEQSSSFITSTPMIAKQSTAHEDDDDYDEEDEDEEVEEEEEAEQEEEQLEEEEDEQLEGEEEEEEKEKKVPSKTKTISENYEKNDVKINKRILLEYDSGNDDSEDSEYDEQEEKQLLNGEMAGRPNIAVKDHSDTETDDDEEEDITEAWRQPNLSQSQKNSSRASQETSDDSSSDNFD